MESLARACAAPEADPDRAGLVGLLSLTPALLGLTTREVCRKLSLDYAVEKALLRREGELGALLTLVEHREARDLVAVDAALEALDLSWSDLEKAELEAIAWNEELAGIRTVGDRPARIG